MALWAIVSSLPLYLYLITCGKPRRITRSEVTRNFLHARKLVCFMTKFWLLWILNIDWYRPTYISQSYINDMWHVILIISHLGRYLKGMKSSNVCHACHAIRNECPHTKTSQALILCSPKHGIPVGCIPYPDSPNVLMFQVSALHLQKVSWKSYGECNICTDGKGLWHLAMDTWQGEGYEFFGGGGLVRNSSRGGGSPL